MAQVNLARRKSKYLQGFYKPINPKKYKGDINNIVFRSSWEHKFCLYCDTNPSVIEWSSEETVIPYLKPIDQRFHRYFIDFKIKVKTPNGIENWLIEIKPASQMVRPKGKQIYRGRIPKAWENYIINTAKWEAAERFASQRGYKFVKLNEYDLGIKPRPSIK